MTWTQFVHSPFIDSLGWTLVHSIWQIGLLAVGYALVNRSFPRCSSHARYAVGGIALVMMLAAPVGTFCGFALHSVSGASLGSTALDNGFLESMQADSGFVSLSTNTDSGRMALVDLDQWAASSEVGNATGKSEPLNWQLWTSVQAALPWLVLTWCGGVLLLAMRPLLALHHTKRLRSTAQVISSGSVREMVENLSSRMGLARVVGVAQSGLVAVPTVIGHAQPLILLPLSMATGHTTEQLRAVIAHELAHVRRYDFLANLMQTAIETLLFYHPAMWWLSRAIRIERENCCDDAALLVCDRKTYARALVDLEKARNVPSLELAANGGALYQRIRRIVHPDETAAQLGGSWLAVATVCGILLLISFAAHTHESQAQVAETPRRSAVLEHPAAEAVLQPRVANHDESQPRNLDVVFADDLIKFSGRVVDPHGKPTSGSTIYALRWYWSHDTRNKPLATTRSKEDGSFQISFRKSQFDRDIRKADQWKQTWFIAVADGFGFGVLNLSDVEPDSTNTLRLVADEPLVGRIMDLEGNPISNAEVRPFRVDEAVVGSVDDFVEEIRGGKRVPDAFRSQLGAMYQVDSVPEFLRFPTNEDGRFVIRGIGRDRLTHIEVSGPDIASEDIVALSRKMDPIPTSELPTYSTMNQLYGSDISLVVAPARIIQGLVRDAVTDKPLANVTVRGRVGRRAVQTRTGADGKYRLAGIEKSTGTKLTFISAPTEPYFNREATVPVTAGLRSAELNVKLHKGVWISGRVTDEHGRGVLARVYFVPYIDNPHALPIKQFRQGADDTHYGESALDGSFRIVGLDGHALLGVKAIDPDDFEVGIGARQLKGVRGTDAAPRIYALIGVDHLNQVMEINARARQKTTSHHFIMRQSAATSKDLGANADWNEVLETLRQEGLDIAIVFDSTGSMGAEIREVRAQIDRIGARLKDLIPTTRISICTYRDEGDEYVACGLPLTDNLGEIASFLASITADGGGDFREAVHEGLRWTVENNQFRDGARKVVLLFGDAPPRNSEYSKCLNLASSFRQQNGTISTLTCRRPAKMTEFEEIAHRGGGEALITTDARDIVAQLLVMVFGVRYRSNVVKEFGL